MTYLNNRIALKSLNNATTVHAAKVTDASSVTLFCSVKPEFVIMHTNIDGIDDLVDNIIIITVKDQNQTVILTTVHDDMYEYKVTTQESTLQPKIFKLVECVD